MNTDDWKHWRCKENVLLWEACLLALDCDPRVTDRQGGFDFDRDCGANTWTPHYFCELLQFAAVHVTDQGPLFAKSPTPHFPYQVEIDLREFGKWIASEGLELPEGFPERVPPSLTKRTEIATRERDTLERVIKAMEMEAGLEPSDNSSVVLSRDYFSGRIKELMTKHKLDPTKPWVAAECINLMFARHGLETVSTRTLFDKIREINAPTGTGVATDATQQVPNVSEGGTTPESPDSRF